MPKLRAVQPTPPGLAMSYVPDARIVDGGQITPRRSDQRKLDDDPEVVKEGSTRQGNSLYYQKLIGQWLHKGDIPRWTAEVIKWAEWVRRNRPYFFNLDCKPGDEHYKAPWSLVIPRDALQAPNRGLIEDGSAQITAKGQNDVEYEVARCPLWAAIQLMQHHKFIERGLKTEEVIRKFAPSNLLLPQSDDFIYDDPDYDDDDYDEPGEYLDYDEDE